MINQMSDSQGELTITSDMEDLENSLFLDQIPSVWMNRAYPSLLGLGAWFSDLLLRIRELETWTTDFVVSYIIRTAKGLTAGQLDESSPH